MKTSNFANNQRYDLNGISISRYPAARQGFNGLEFPALFPPAELLAAYKAGMGWGEYAERYKMFTLRCLDPQKTFDTLTIMAALHQIEGPEEPPEPILLCYESAKTLDTQPCHRRLVAAWFERELGVVVPEWSKEVPL